MNTGVTANNTENCCFTSRVPFVSVFSVLKNRRGP